MSAIDRPQHWSSYDHLEDLNRPQCQTCHRTPATAYGKWVRCDSCAEQRLDALADAILEGEA